MWKISFAGLLVLCMPLTVLSVENTSTPAAGAQQPITTVLSFKEWRNEKSAQIRSRYTKLESEYLAKKSANPQDSSLKALYSELKNTKSQLDEIEEMLTFASYFVVYLSGFKDQKEAIRAAAQKLDSLEVAELMKAYADSLLKTRGDGLTSNFTKHATEASK